MTDQPEQPVRDGTDPGGLSTEQLDDLAAERDDAADTGDGGPGQQDGLGAEGEPGEQPTFFHGAVRGGPAPYAGSHLLSRYPAGVVLIDKPARRVWIYTFDPHTSVFTAGPELDLDDEKRWVAAAGGDYDVRAYDDEFTGDDTPTEVGS